MNKDCFIVYFEDEPIFLADTYYKARKMVKYLKKYSFYDSPKICVRRYLK